MIHQYELNGHRIVLDAGSGSIHAVDALAYALIRFLDQGLSSGDAVAAALSACPEATEADARETMDDIEALRAAGKLFAPDIALPAPSPLKAAPVVKALCLHVAHSCNLACAYCFAGQGKYRGERALMPLEVGRRALEFLVEHSGSRRNLEVDFFGGEPLLNWDVVKQLVAYARELENTHGKRFRFTLTTNGVLLDGEVTEFLNREMHNVVLSLDGRRQVNDRLRKTPSGGGSYDLIVPKFQAFVKARGSRGYYMRGTFTRENLDFVEDILHMADLGFKELSMEPVVSAPGDPAALSEADLPKLFEQYERLAQVMIEREKAGEGFTFYHYMLDLTGGPCIHKRLQGCGSGTEYLAVTPSGELYPCHQFVGEPEYRLGDLESGVTNVALRERFAAADVLSRGACQGCWAKLWCSGGCAANAHHAAGSIEGVYAVGCELFKKRLECAVMMQVAKMQHDTDTP